MSAVSAYLSIYVSPLFMANKDVQHYLSPVSHV